MVQFVIQGITTIRSLSVDSAGGNAFSFTTTCCYVLSVKETKLDLSFLNKCYFSIYSQTAVKGHTFSPWMNVYHKLYLLHFQKLSKFKQKLHKIHPNCKHSEATL